MFLCTLYMSTSFLISVCNSIDITMLTGEDLGDRKRHYSAPNDDGIISPPPIRADESAKLLVGQEIPRTRSTTSLQELLQVNAAPALQPSERTLSVCIYFQTSSSILYNMTLYLLVTRVCFKGNI